MSEFLGVVTAIGQQKMAASIGGAVMTPSLIRVGDGNGAAIVPVEGMIDLVRRVGVAYPIISAGRDPGNANAWRFETLIPEADGPFEIREIGLFDAAGDMIAVARHPLVEKRSAAQGALMSLITQIIIPVSETAQIALNLLPDAGVSIFQQLRVGFMAVESATVANPPANPPLGASYVVPAAPTGAWAGMTGRIVQWNGNVWVNVLPPTGHLVVVQDRALDDATRWLRREAGGWVSARASETALGVVKLATKAQAQARADDTSAVTPRGLTGIVGAGVDFRTVINASTSAPPAAPALFDSYLIAAAPAPSGVWAGHAGKLATWDGAEWIIEQMRLGARIIDRSTAVTSANRELRQMTALAWSPVQATNTDFGHARRATPAEVRAGAQVNAYVVPEDLVGIGDQPIGSLPFPEIYTADARAAISVGASAGNGGEITVTGGEIVTLGQDMGDGMGRQRRVILPAAAFAGLAANSTYFVRLRLNGGAPEVYIQRGTLDEAEPVGLVGTPGAATLGGFCSTRLDVRLAKVTTGANGTAPVIRRYAVRSRHVFFGPKATGNVGWAVSWSSGIDSVAVAWNGDGSVSVNWNFIMDWDRKPVIWVPMASVWVSNATAVQYLGSTANRALMGPISSEQTSITGMVSDYAESQLVVAGNFSWYNWGADASLLLEA
jgi:phage-related tail fiber protein